MKILRLKAVISTLLAISFIVLAVSGGVLHFGMTGMIWGIARITWRSIHFWAGAGMCVFIIIHIILNLRIYLSELRAFKKRF